MIDRFFINPFCNYDEPISLFACGYGHTKKNHSVGPQIRNEYILHYVEYGKGYYEVGGKTYTVNKGSIFAIFPGEIIKYYSDSKNPWTNCWINFVGKDAEAFLARTKINRTAPVLAVKNNEYVKTIQRCLKYALNGRYTQTRLSAYTLEFLSLIEENDTCASLNRERYVNSALSFMEYYYGNNISASDVSDYVGIDRTYFYRIFKNATGVSPTDYLLNLRIEKAKQLISSGESFASTASAVGINDVYYFSKLFLKITKMTPSKYRKNLVK